MSKQLTGLFMLNESGVYEKFYIESSDDIYRARSLVYGLQNWYSLNKDKKSESYVWDEDKTVRQNKEMTVAYNASIDAEIEKRKQIYSDSLIALEEAIEDFIIEDLRYDNITCSREQASKIWNFCKQQWEDDPHNYIHDVMTFYSSLFN